VTIASVDLNLMLVLHTVLEEQNVARAAERLHVTPSAVSNALARLRDVFSDPLVTRRGRGVVPTPRAVEMAPAIARAMREIETALHVTPFDPASCTRTFTLAVADLGQVTWVPALVEALRRGMPRARLRVVSIDGLIALGDLASSEVDLHVGSPATGPGIHATRLFDACAVLVARKEHPLARGRARPSRQALASLQHVAVNMLPSRQPRDPFAPLFARARIPRDVVVTVPSFTAAAEIVARGDLVTVLPSSFLAAKRESLRLVELSTPLPAHRTPIAMCWHERTHDDAAARAFRAMVREVVAPPSGR
jgi:DNA-binding transcriptional LysR family regulator